MLMYASLFLTGLSIFLVTSLMFQEEDEYKAQEKLESGAGSDKETLAQHGIVLRYSRPFFRRYVTPIVASFKNKKKIREKYKRNLASAGLTEILSPEDFFSFKLFLIVGFPIVFLGLRTFLEETWPLNYIFPISIFGFFYPDLWIKGKIQERQQEIIRNMPFAVDMLALSVEAGLDFIAAMSKVNEKAKPSALTKEFEILMKEIKIGASRAEALRNMAWRVDLIQISSFCATLIAADSVGASIGPILKALSVEIRQKRSSDVEKAGATAATKILFPMLFLIVPAVFIVVGAPLALEAMMGGR
jgi:tight adherence protein C